MNTPNINNSLINVDQIELQRKILEAEKEILKNIEDYALLFSRIQKATTLEEFNRIVSEDAANNDSFTDNSVNISDVKNEVDNNEENSDSWSKIKLSVPKVETTDELKEDTNTIDTNEDELKTITNEEESKEPSGPPKIKLNFWSFTKAANDENAEDQQKAA